MTEKKGKKRDSAPLRRASPTPAIDAAAERKMQRDTFVHTFFKKGAEFTDELLRENDRLRKQQIELDADNTRLRSQLASDEAIRDLLRKIDQLEREKQNL